MLERLDRFRLWMLRRPLAVALLLLPYVEITGVTTLSPAADWAMVAWKGVSMLCIAAMFLAKPRFSAVSVMIYAYQALLFAVTLLHGMGGLRIWVFPAASTVACCMLVELCLAADPKALVKGGAGLLALLCIADLASILLFPDGMHTKNSYLLGHDNQYAIYVLPAMGLTLLCAAYQVRSKKTWGIAALVLVLAASVSYITWSASAVVCTTAFIGIMVLYKLRKSYDLFNISVFYLVTAVLFFTIVIFRLQEALSFLIEDMLGKSLTFTGRTEIWDKALACFKEAPIWGHGATSIKVYNALVGNRHLHDRFLQILYETGIAGMAVYVGTLALLITPLMKRRAHLVGYVLAAALFGMLLYGLVEVPFVLTSSVLLQVMAYHVEDVISAFEGQALPEGGAAA